MCNRFNRWASGPALCGVGSFNICFLFQDIRPREAIPPWRPQVELPGRTLATPVSFHQTSGISLPPSENIGAQFPSGKGATPSAGQDFPTVTPWVHDDISTSPSDIRESLLLALQVTHSRTQASSQQRFVIRSKIINSYIFLFSQILLTFQIWTQFFRNLFFFTLIPWLLDLHLLIL